MIVYIVIITVSKNKNVIICVSFTNQLVMSVVEDFNFMVKV